MTEQKQPAWSKIEADYRAGVKSLRQIASEQGVTEGGIRKRAKKEDWERDLKAKIQAKAESIVRKEAVRNSERIANHVPESEIVDAGAMEMATVQLSHRKSINRHRSLGTEMLRELENQTFSQDLFEELGPLVIGPPIFGDDPADKAAERRRLKLQEALDRTLSLPSRVDSMKKLAETLKTLVALEREAYGISADQNTGKSYEDDLDDL